jgi:hypothetical protein
MFRKFLLSATILAVSGQAFAQTTPSPATTNSASPNSTLSTLESQAASGSNTPAAVIYLEKEGVKLTYLGGDGGIRAYLGQDPQGKFQAFYIAPDGTHFIAGLMFGESGQDTTGAQIQQMKDRFQTLTSGETPAPVSEPSVGSVPVGSTPTAAAPDVTAAPQANAVPTPALPMPSSGAPNSTSAPAPAVQADGSSLQMPGMQTTSSIANLTEQKFNSELNSAFYFTNGYKHAPVVFMIADPQCEYCHAAWQILKPMVEQGEVQLNVIIVSGLPGSTPYAIGLLSTDKPGLSWYNGEGSTAALQLIPKPPAVGTPEYNKISHWLDANDDLAKNIGMTKTPFLAYVGKTGVFHKIQAPDDLKGFLNDLPPANISQ